MNFVLFRKDSGRVLAVLDENQNFEDYCCMMSDDTKAMLDSIYFKNMPKDYESYRVLDDSVEKLEDVEIEELNSYGRILTNEERLLNKLSPSQEEVKKAENTIEILSLLEEVT